MGHHDKDILPSEDYQMYNIRGFKDKIKAHLSNEYIYIMEKKDDLENQLISLKMEENQKKKVLFPNIEQKNIRSYFSPFSIKEEDLDDKNDQDKNLSMNIDHLKREILEMDLSMEEIKDILLNIDQYLDDYEKKEEEKKNNNNNKEEESNGADPLDSLKDNGFPQNGDKFTKIVDYFYIDRNIYPQMIRNLYDYADFLRKEFNHIEVFIEFNDNNIETDPELNRSLLSQINYNIKSSLEYFDISTILIQGGISGKKIQIIINYICDEENINAMSVNYDIEYDI